MLGPSGIGRPSSGVDRALTPGTRQLPNLTEDVMYIGLGTLLVIIILVVLLT